VSKRRQKGLDKLTTKAAGATGLDPLFVAAPRLWGAEPTLYGESVLIYAATRAITSRMSAADVQYITPGSKDPIVPDAEVAAVFDGPNLIQDGSTFWAAVEAYRLHHGGYIAVLMRSGQLIQPGQIPDTILPFPLTGWRRVAAGGSAFATEGWANDDLRLVVGSSQCVTVIDNDPSGRFALISATSTVREAATTQVQVDQYTSSLLANGGRPGFVVTTEANMQEQDKQRFRSQWEAMYSGSYNAGRTALLTGGKWGLQEISPMKPGDVAGDAFFRDSVRKVGMAFRVPEFELGITQDSNRASSAEIRASFLTGTIIPTFRLHEKAWARQFFRRLGLRYSLRFNEFSLPEFADVVGSRADNVGKLIAAGTPRNEAYRINGIPVQDQPWGETALVASTLQRAETITAEPATPATVAPAPESAAAKEPEAAPKPEEPKAKAATIQVKRLPASMRLKALGDTQRRKQAVAIWDKCAAPFEEPIATSSAKWAKRWKGYFMKRLNYFLKTGEQIDETSAVAKSLSVVIEWKASEDPHIPTAGDIATMMPPEAETVPALQNTWRSVFLDVEAATVAQMAVELGDVSEWLAMPPEAHRVVALDRLGDAIKVDETIRRQLSEAMRVELSRQPMPSPPQLAAALRQEAGQVFDRAIARASTIARTEVGNVLGDYRAAVMEAEGVKKKRWSAVHDGHTRESHLRAEGAGAIAWAEKFPNGLTRPHDPVNGTGADVINCRCVLLPVMED